MKSPNHSLSLASLALALAVAVMPAAAAGASGARGNGDAAADEAITAPKAAPVSLNNHVMVTGNFVQLGDLFGNAGENAAINVAYAPAPGDRATFDARWLYRVAKAYKLDWRPMSKLDQAVVERDSIVVGREEIEDKILLALQEKGLEQDMLVRLSNRMMQMHLPVDSSGEVGVEDVMYDQRTHRFTAILVAPAGDPSAERTRLSGKVHRMVEIPALTQRTLAGEVITARDVQWLRMRADRVQANVIMEAEDLIGMTPKRGLRAGSPVRTSDVQRPVLVPKNSLVTMLLQTPYMTLTAQGKALESGSEGDVIRISNSKSNNVVEGVVTGASRVAVRPAGQILTN